MAVAKKVKKDVVRVEPTKEGESRKSDWKPTPEAKSKATTYRIIALLLWALAIAGEVFLIFKVLKETPVNMVLLIGGIIVIGILAVIGNLLWKQSNRLDPAYRSDTVRFFIQNQLGAIISIIAFLPIIVLILMNKDMDTKQKGIATAVGAVVLVLATLSGVTLNSPSVEQYTAETDYVMSITGQNLVYWTKAGNVYHLCAGASDLPREAKDMTIYSGTVADAHAAGKERLTLKVDEEIKQCGLTAPAVASPTPKP